MINYSIKVIFLLIILFIFSTQNQTAWAKKNGIDKVFQINSFERSVQSEQNVATRTIKSESNIPFTIPYIQTNTSITASVAVAKKNTNLIKNVFFTLSKNGQVEENRIVTKPYKTVFENLSKGEYTLDAYALDAQGNKLKDDSFHDQVTNIGIGDIIVAIGDSTTEGYYLYKKPIPNWLSAPKDYLSYDNRTYPQPGGKAKLPTRTWLPDLSNRLSQLYGYPVFIKSAGYSEFDSSKYLVVMKTKGWQEHQHELSPNKWIILLGVNDGLFKVSATQYDKNLRNIIETLKNNYHAQSNDIFLAKPTYTIGVDHTKNLLPVIDEIWNEKLVAKGPDFWAFFSTRFYPTFAYYRDQFHQTPAGMKEIARLWVFPFADQENFFAKSLFYIQVYANDFYQRVIHKFSTLKMDILKK